MTDASIGRPTRRGSPTTTERGIGQTRLARPIRVLQTFGEPRATTNPYIVMLRTALIEEPTVEHIPFSWRTALTGNYDVLHVHWPDALLAGRHWWTRSGKRVGFAGLIVRTRVRRVATVRTVHNVTPPSGPRASSTGRRATPPRRRCTSSGACRSPYRCGRAPATGRAAAG